MSKAVALGMTLLLLDACAAAPSPASPAPTGSSEVTPQKPETPATAAASPLSCASPLPPFAGQAATAATPPPGVGQMSEEAAQAKRLFDGEKWDQAVLALDRVINGDTGDDEGNKQLASYHRAVALRHAGRSQESAAAFLKIAAQPTHHKRSETLLWLVKLAESAPEVIHGFRFYEAKDAERFANPQQMEVHQGALFLLGRERFERGQKSEARELFAQVQPAGRWYALARECMK